MSKPTISERLHTIKEQLRKGDAELSESLDELIRLQVEIDRNVKKAFSDKSHPLHFDSGDLRIICTLIRTKLNNYNKKLYCETISTKFESFEQVTDKEFIQVISQSITDYEIFKKLGKCHFLYGTITATCELVEVMRKCG